jgi:hypothetical protein
MIDVDIEQIKDKLGIGDDKVYAVMGEFSDPHDLVHAGRKIREMGYTKLDAMTPFPVHGIDDALGIPYSKLGWIVICIGLTGSATALLLQWWCGTINYPLVIGGKPLFDFTFSIPITFELTVLFSSFAAVIGMFALNGLPKLYHPSMNYRNAHRATDDRFLLVIEADDPKFDPQKTAEHLRSVGANEVEVVEG